MPSLAVSAVIPTYNRAELVRRAVRSALEALRPGDEVIVVDDGSTDGTPSVVESFGSPVRLLQTAHGGAGAARNAGIAAARGPLVAFLDSDDEWFPDKIDLQRSFLERRPDVVYCASDFGVRFASGAERHGYLSYWLRKPRPLAEVFGPGEPYSSFAPLPPGRADFDVYVGDMYLEAMRNNFIAAFTLMARKDVAGDALRFAEDLPTCEEWQAFGRLAGRGPGAVFDTDTAWQHGHDGPRLTQQPMHVWAEARLSTLKRVWGSDPEFIRGHAGDFRHAVSETRLLRSCSLAREGRVRELPRALGLAAAHPRTFHDLWRANRAKRGAWAA